MASREDRQMNAEYNEIRRTASFMQSPNEWVNWPVLTVIQRSGDRRAGIMTESTTPRVWVNVLMWGLEAGPLIPQLDAKATEVKTYESFEDCAQEWRID